MKRRIGKKIISILLVTGIVMTGCGKNNATQSNEPITLNVYSQLANYSGLQAGWMADILLEKFNVKLNIIPDSGSTFQTRMENKNLGDIIIWGGNTDMYTRALKAGLLYDLDEDNLIQDYGKDIVNNMSDSLEKNRGLTSSLTDGEKNTLHGWGHDIATSNEEHQSFNYTWDIRWDLYKKLGYPKINNLNEFADLLKKMQKLDPKDDAGNKTYAVSLWPDWDDTMAMYVKATAAAYYGYDELGMGLYDSAARTYYDALEEDGPYIEMLKFYNKLYREGLVDPNSMTQTYDQMAEKVQNGGVLFSIFNYSGSLLFNSDEHIKNGQYMYCMKPEKAAPVVYGMSTQGGNYITSIGAQTQYPELCMEILNYFCTPEGFMTYTYGPKEECWYYDEEGNTHFTDLGEQCKNNVKTKMKNNKGTFQDGQLQMAVSTWARDAVNLDSNGETYNSNDWKSTQKEATTTIEKDWRKVTGSNSLNEYFEKGNYTVVPATSYIQSEKSDELKTIWSQASNAVVTGSWNAIYADTDAEFNATIVKMRKDVKGYGYEKCLEWSLNEASIRKSLEEETAR